MATVTYLKQPGIHKTRGSVPLAGTSHIYTVTAVLWPPAVEQWIAEQLVGTTLHVCCGKSQLGDVRLDLYEEQVDVQADAARLPFCDESFDSVLCDPPYSSKFQWNHDLLNELHRIARQRIIFQHWFSPCNPNGEFKKARIFKLTQAAVVPVVSEPQNFVPAFRGDDGCYYLVEEDPEDPKVFTRTDLVYWQGRTYFGRVQLISVFDRAGESQDGWSTETEEKRTKCSKNRSKKSAGSVP